MIIQGFVFECHTGAGAGVMPVPVRCRYLCDTGAGATSVQR